MLYKRIWLTLVIIGLLGLLSACGQLFVRYPKEQPYRVALMVTDLNADPLGGAVVWIDNELMDERTAAEFTPLGEGFPNQWAGWPANYVSPLLNTWLDSEDDVDHIEIIVARSGYTVSRTGFDLGDVEGTFFFRAVIPMEPYRG